MKKIIPVLLGVVASISTAVAQGTVNFNNSVAFGDNVDRLVYLDPAHTTALVGVNWAAILVFGATADALNTFATKTTDTTYGGSLAKFRDPSLGVGQGTWVGGTRVLPGVAAGTTQGPGGTTMLQVRVWDLSLFATYDLAVAGHGYTGHSDAFSYTVPAAGSLPSASFMTGLNAFDVGVPEPSTIVLGALGLASLLFLRRRK